MRSLKKRVSKQSIIVDTNILVSSILGKSYPHRIVYDLILTEKVHHLISDEIFREFEDTLSHKKFEKIQSFKDEALDLLSEIKTISIVKNPTFKLAVLQDIDDNKFLELALLCRADFLITGNSRHFTYGLFESTEIISPEKYWNTYWK